MSEVDDNERQRRGREKREKEERKRGNNAPEHEQGCKCEETKMKKGKDKAVMARPGAEREEGGFKTEEDARRT